MLGFLQLFSFPIIMIAALLPPLRSPTLDTPELRAWSSASFHAVNPLEGRHSIHSYYVSCPESPDGRYVLYYTSQTPEGEVGEIRILERATGAETILARDVHTEDAHRAACQQWLSGGKTVAFHDFRDGHWLVVAVDVETRSEKILAKDRQIGFGAPQGDWVPIYGWHWKLGEHRDLELVNAKTGEIKTAITVAEVTKQHGEEITEMVGPGEVSIFFPVMSPNGKKVFFKISRGGGTDDFKSPKASAREGKFVYNLEDGSFIRLFRQWGHPSWSPDSAGIFEKYKERNVFYNLETGEQQTHAEGSPTDHPSIAPGGKIFVSDGGLRKHETGKPGEWGIVVGSLEADEYSTLYRFDNSGGANSWRKNHPHPVFSSDGKRIYFNVNSGAWTRLFVAEIGS